MIFGGGSMALPLIKKSPRILSLALFCVLIAVFLQGCGEVERAYPPERPIEPPLGMNARTWGAALFRDHGCAGCHNVGGVDEAGGTMLGLIGKVRRLEGGGELIADRDYLVRSILDPSAELVLGQPDVMPSYKGRLGEEELDALVDFLVSLR